MKTIVRRNNILLPFSAKITSNKLSANWFIQEEKIRIWVLTFHTNLNYVDNLTSAQQALSLIMDVRSSSAEVMHFQLQKPCVFENTCVSCF